MIFGLIAVIAAILVVVARYLVSARIQRLNQEVLDAERGLRQVKLNLKASENKQAVAELELQKQEREKSKLEMQIRKLDKELGE